MSSITGNPPPGNADSLVLLARLSASGAVTFAPGQESIGRSKKCGTDPAAWLVEHTLPSDLAQLKGAVCMAGVQRRNFRWGGRLRWGETICWIAAEGVFRGERSGVMEWRLVVSVDQRESIRYWPSLNTRDGRALEALPVPLMILRANLDGELIFVNRAFRESFGYGLNELASLHGALAIGIDDEVKRGEVEREILALMKGLIDGDLVDSQVVEFLVTDRWEKARNLQLNISLVDDVLMLIPLDLTSYRVPEARLVPVDEKLRETAYELTENIPVGTYTMVLEPGQEMARFSFMSRRFLEMLGVSREDAIRTPENVFLAVHPDDLDDWMELNRKAFLNRAPFYGETRIVVAGDVRWVTAESSPRELPDGTTVWEGALIDVTKQRRAEQELLEAHAELTAGEADRARMEERRRLLEDMHDGFASQLSIARLRLRQQELTTEEVEGVLQDCLNDLHLVVDTLHSTDNNLSSSLADLRHRMASGLDRVSWNIALKDCPRLDPRMILQLLRILQEALANAVKHSLADHIEVAVSYRPEDGICLSVRDDGVGIQAPTGRTGHGMRNMHRRAQSLGAVLDIISLEPGTELRLVVPAGQLMLSDA